MGYRKYKQPVATSIVALGNEYLTMPGQWLTFETGEHLSITPYAADDLFACRLELVASNREYRNGEAGPHHEPRVCREAYETASALALWLNAEFITPTCC